MDTESLVLLHLTDLHFGCDRNPGEVAARDLALRGLTTALRKLGPDWKPNIVCVSGDIGWKGSAEDYGSAQGWLEGLLSDLGLSTERLLLCPGNHDIDRNISQKYARPKDGPDADGILAVPLASVYQDAFRAFTEFARSFGIPPYHLGDDNSYLVGERKIDGISFCAVNSSWFCRGGRDDQGKLWIGRPQIDVLEHYGQLTSPENRDSGPPTVTLIHHPREWLHDDEIHARGQRMNTFDAIARRCHLMLSGHAHGESRRADRYAEGAWHLNGGATYAGSDYHNGFTIIRVEEDRFIYRTFEYNPRSADREWQQTIEAKILSFREKTAPFSEAPEREAFEQRLNDYRVAAVSHAQSVVEAKSRALRQWGALPKTLPLRVSVQAQGARPRFDQFGQLEYEVASVALPLLDAARTSKRSLLLGDLGTGKSTVSAGYVIDFQNTTANSLAIYTPAKSIPIATEGGSLWKTVKEFLQAVASYFSGQVCPERPALNLETILDSRVELVLIVDGLDEVHPNVAQNILNHLAAIVDHWPTTQVLATGRPVELAGVDYAKWQVLTTVTLTDDEKLDFFAEEAIADGTSLEKAAEMATVALQKLRSIPDLHSLATTPLFCRLLFNQLEQRLPGRTTTLGDLLCELVRERLGEWSKKDSKASPTPLFDSFYPDTDSRAALLSQLALKLHTRGRMRIEEARLYLDSLLPPSAGAGKPPLVEEALRSFGTSGLIVVVDGEIQFPLRPFEEFCCGYAYAVLASGNVQHAMQLNVAEWRVASFAATMARRLGLTDGLRHELLSFLHQLLQVSGNVPAAAYVISEFQDQTTASSYIEELKALGHRPLWLSFDAQDWLQSAHAIAESLRLAGDVGFEWFFSEYLDPHYPFVFFGSRITEEVFEQWAAMHVGQLTGDQRSKLSSLVQPHLSAASHQIISLIPLLSVLTPDAFEKTDRLWFCTRLLDKMQFREPAEQAIRKAVQDGDARLVGDLLLDTAASGFENARAAVMLHLSIFDSRPPLEAVRALVRAERGLRNHHGTEKGLQKLVEELGPECVNRFLRWFLFDPDTMVAAGAAIELCNLGEQRLYMVGNALLRALHDGGYVPQAEEILTVLVQKAGAGGVNWLARHIAEQSENLDRAHSGWWRILLSMVGSVGPDGPRLLASCMGGVGEFLLARYPEVRQKFRELLTGPDQTSYRSTLRDHLNHPDPAIRHGAAMVLVTTDPATEARALEEVVRSKSRGRYGSWHEWERFCLSLNFGPSVVSHLQSKLSTFPAEAEILALAILYRNGAKLQPLEFERLVSGELTWALGVDQPSEVLQPHSIFDVLLKIAEGESQQLAPRAAERLLGSFSEKLAAAQRARIVALTLTGSGWHTADFEKEFLRMKQDPAFGELIRQESERLVHQGFQRPVIDLLYQAEKEPSLWENIIWNELCGRVIGHDVERHGQWILDIMRKFPEQARVVGPVARKFLFDPRLAQAGGHDAITWLALLANEAGELSEAEIEQVIIRHNPIDRSALVALLARLGHIPTGFPARDSVGMPPSRRPGRRPMQPPPIRGVAMDALHECARPGEALHPQLCSTIEESLFGDPLTGDQLKSLAQVSLNGILIGGALAMVYGQLPEVEWARKILGYRRPYSVPEVQCHSRIVEIWQRLLDAARDDNDWQHNYVAELNRALCTESGDISAIASELLGLQGWLDPKQISITFRQLTQDIFDDYELTARLSDWLSGSLSVEIRDSVADSVEKGLSSLDAQPWNSNQSDPKDAGPYLILPLLHWRITNQSDDRSKRVFLRGLKIALIPERQGPRRESRQRGIEDVFPLLNTVPTSYLQEVIRYGASIEDLAVRGVCKLFALEFPGSAGSTAG